MSDYLLEMRNISKSFFGINALCDVSIQVLTGEVHILLGENGAGKSTLMKVLSCVYRKDSGEIWLDGREVFFKDPKDAINNGISIIYQEFNLNPHMSIAENIFLGKEFTRRLFIDSGKTIKEADYYMRQVGLNENPATLVKDLSISQKQLVEIAKAISNDVKILVLDEPTAAITEKETIKLFDLIAQLKQKGIGIIYISHRMSELFKIGDRCTVLRDGRFVKTVVLNDTPVVELTRLMVGRDVKFERKSGSNIKSGTTVLCVENLNYKNILKDVSLTLSQGEMLGISGLIGAGRTELAKCIIGAYQKNSGKVTLFDKDITHCQVAQTIENGLVYLSEDRKDEGLVLIHDLIDNFSLPNLKLFSSFFLDHKKLGSETERYISKLRLKTSSCFEKAINLSGGNQQKLVIAKWLRTNAKVYIFDEPTRGIDVGARKEIYEIMESLVRKGASIILISSDLTEILRLADNIIVMHKGRVKASLPNTYNLSQETILSYAIDMNGD